MAYNGKPLFVGGTSASTPVRLSCLRRPFSGTQLTANAQTAAGIVSLLNDRVLSKGKKPLGFLNPWLYGDGLAGLNDIKSGSNDGCGTDGFTAIAGWDPVSHAMFVSLHFRCWLTLGL